MFENCLEHEKKEKLVLAMFLVVDISRRSL